MPRLSKTCAVVGLMLAWASITGAVGAAAALELRQANEVRPTVNLE
jgi:hypothetical protein